jgi:uncharacterized protein (TIGR02284 family)
MELNEFGRSAEMGVFMAVTTEVNSTLNDLIQICTDGEKGFADAAEHVEDASLKLELTDYSLQRHDFAADLQSLVQASGEEASHSGDTTGALHRAWIDIKAKFAGNDKAAILAECERGEDAAVKAYEKALEKGLPVDYSQLVQSQYTAVKRTHDRIKALRDAAKE